MSLLLIIDKGDEPLGVAAMFQTDELTLTRELVLATMNEFGFSHTGDEDDLVINLAEDSQGPYASVWDAGDTNLKIIMWAGDNDQIVNNFMEIESPSPEKKEG